MPRMILFRQLSPSLLPWRNFTPIFLPEVRGMFKHSVKLRRPTHYLKQNSRRKIPPHRQKSEMETSPAFSPLRLSEAFPLSGVGSISAPRWETVIFMFRFSKSTFQNHQNCDFKQYSIFMLSNNYESQTGELSSWVVPLWVSTQNIDLLYIFMFQTVSHGEEEETHWIILWNLKNLKMVFINSP